MNINQLMKQAEAMQKKMQAAQAEMENQEFEGQAGGGMVKAVQNGAGKLLKLDIDNSIITPDDKEMLEDLVIAAINDGNQKREEASKNNLSGALPPGMKMPF